MLYRLIPAAIMALLGLTSCATTGSGLSGNAAAQMATRQAQIAQEPAGDYWVGRRFHIERTHLWGYLRRPGESWDKSRLVILSERVTSQPDRLPETANSDLRYGYDHNCEYHFWGEFSGRRIYDPNSNLILPEFTLRRHKLVSTSPGWLFRPGERFNGNQLLRAELGANP
jgi:hypothetical protein